MEFKLQSNESESRESRQGKAESEVVATAIS